MPYIGQINIFPYGFAPEGWAFCRGQLLPVSENTELFSLIGTKFGGDGESNFALPNYEGMAPTGSDYFICLQGGAQAPRAGGAA
jgi:microcystin-dependent protein